MIRVDPAPWFIAHRAGESRARLQRTQALAATHLELDLRLEGGRVICRHDALLLGSVPYVTQRHGIPRLRLRRVWLDEMRTEGGIFLDFKEPGPELVARTLAALRASGRLGAAAASTPVWPLLDQLREQAPEVPRFYSIGRRRAQGEAQWHAYEQRISRNEAGAGVSIHHDTATAARLRQLREAGLRAICYTINDFATGVRLLEHGAGGLTTDRYGLIARWRAWLDARER